MRLSTSIALIVLTGTGLAASQVAGRPAAGFRPPVLVESERPPLPPLTVGWSTALLIVQVDASGRVADVESVSDDVGIAAAVRNWRFRPARHGSRAVPAPVLVAALYRPRALREVVPPPDLSREAASLGDRVPHPAETPAPSYPPRALGDGVTIVEVEVSETGRVSRVAVAASAPGFDDAARESAAMWRFRPARRDGSPVAATVYLVFGFRAPVVAAPVAPTVTSPTDLAVLWRAARLEG